MSDGAVFGEEHQPGGCSRDIILALIERGISTFEIELYVKGCSRDIILALIERLEGMASTVRITIVVAGI